MAPAIAATEVEKAMAMSPSNGAEYLKQRGLDYLQCFKLLSAVTAEELRNERNQGGGRLKTPAVMILAGGVMILIGAFGVFRGLSVHSNAMIIDQGITLCFGIFSCIWPLVKSGRMQGR